MTFFSVERGSDFFSLSKKGALAFFIEKKGQRLFFTAKKGVVTFCHRKKGGGDFSSKKGGMGDFSSKCTPIHIYFVSSPVWFLVGYRVQKNMRVVTHFFRLWCPAVSRVQKACGVSRLLFVHSDVNPNAGAFSHTAVESKELSF